MRIPILRWFKCRASGDRKYYALLKTLFGFTPHNIDLYKLALIHRSASVVLDDGSAINNERLEFLGDAILESIVSDFLFIEFPDKNEGVLTQMRSKIVSRVSLNEIALHIGLDKHIIVQYSNNHIQKHLYGDALEAMIGAMYLDKGYDFVNRLVINNILRKNVNLHKIMQEENDYKSRLIEWCQKHRSELVFSTHPSPRVSDHHPSFVCTAAVDGLALGDGEGSSKKEAEQMAAQQALSILKKRKNTVVNDNIPAEHILSPGSKLPS
ncbi:MAG: ribonuclease III [Rikenellaceae bacterium]|nr:ribonuclease III [Rikenellaceae bacterium]